MTRRFNNVIFEDASIRTAARSLEDLEAKALIVVNSRGEVSGAVTDGDIRRGLIESIDINSPISQVMCANPLTFKQSDDPGYRLMTMRKRGCCVAPVVDENRRCVDLEITLPNKNKEDHSATAVCLMAGGFGTRLLPLTENLPKPMLPVGGVPLLEILLLQLKGYGFKKFYFSVHYYAEVIIDHFGDGSDFGVEIVYLHERNPLGTAGALGLINGEHSFKRLLVMNGDILTGLNFSNMVDAHIVGGNQVSVAVREIEHSIAYGVVECDGDIISAILEKPTYRFNINSGIYILDFETLKEINSGSKCDMPLFIQNLLAKDIVCRPYELNEFWLDVGQIKDYEKAQNNANRILRICLGEESCA